MSHVSSEGNPSSELSGAASTRPAVPGSGVLSCLGRGCLLMVAGSVVLGCLLMLFFTWVLPAWSILQARSWVATPCTIIESELRSDSGDGSTYRTHIRYEYVVQGQTYVAERYKFLEVATNFRASKLAIIEQFPPGAQRTCYYNPADPSEAVLERGWTADLLFGLAPLFMIVLAIGAVRFLPRWWRGWSQRLQAAALTRTGKQDWLPTEPRQRAERQEAELASAATRFSSDSAATESVVLEPTVTPHGQLIFGLLFAGFWNGIIGIFVVQLVYQLLRGERPWFFMILLSPFVLIGVALIGYVVYSFLALFNARPTLRLNRRRLQLGDTVEIHWQFRGNTHSLRRVHLFLKGEEIARYRRGTNNYTDRHQFAAITVADVSSTRDTESGQAEFTIPHDTMHSLALRNNSIQWTLELLGEVAFWPDVSQSYLLTIEPAPLDFEQQELDDPESEEPGWDEHALEGDDAEHETWEDDTPDERRRSDE